MTGLDDEEKAKGLFDIDTLWLEEATNFTVDDVALLDGTLRGKVGDNQIYFTFNPVSMQNWVYKHFNFDDIEKQKTNDDLFVLKSTYKDNKWVGEAEKKRLEKLKETNSARYKIEAEGDFATLDKLVYTNWKSEEFDYLSLLRSEDKDLVQLYAMDFGFVFDYTALVCMIADTKNMKLYVYDEHFQKAMLTSDIANMIKGKQLHKTNIVCDRQEHRLIEELNKSGCRCSKCRKGKDSIMPGITKIQEFEIIVLPKCTNIIAELENYCYQKDKSTGEYINKPIDKWNHGMDAMRYGVQELRKKAKIITTRL